jgi:hypothetical protein
MVRVVTTIKPFSAVLTAIRTACAPPMPVNADLGQGEPPNQEIIEVKSSWRVKK